jgi:hypothetical protein
MSDHQGEKSLNEISGTFSATDQADKGDKVNDLQDEWQKVKIGG